MLRNNSHKPDNIPIFFDYPRFPIPYKSYNPQHLSVNLQNATYRSRKNQLQEHNWTSIMSESNDTEANNPQEQSAINSNKNNESNAAPEAPSYLERLAMELGFEDDFVTPRADQPIIPTPNTTAANPSHESLSYLARLAMDLGLQMDFVTCIRGVQEIGSPELEQILAQSS